MVFNWFLPVEIKKIKSTKAIDHFEKEQKLFGAISSNIKKKKQQGTLRIKRPKRHKTARRTKNVFNLHLN